MAERHTVDFALVSMNILSAAEHGTILLQIDRTECEWHAIDRLVRALRRRFGTGLASRFHRFRTHAADPLILLPAESPETDLPDVLRLAAAVRPGVRMDEALGVLLDFCRQHPGYRRTYGAPLDRDIPVAPNQQLWAEPWLRARTVLSEMFRRHHYRGRTP